MFVAPALVPDRALAQGKTLNQLVRRLRPLDPALGNSAVTALLQTRDGYLWIGTEAGLARFDGVRYAVFTAVNTDAFATDHISALLEDTDGTLLIGTFGGGLVTYRNGHFTPSLSSKDGLLSDVVRTVYKDSTGSLWIATRSDGSHPGGLNRLRDGVLSAFTVADGLPTADIWSLCEDHSGALWLGTYGGGLTRYAGGTFTTFTTKDGLAGNDIRSIVVDSADALWIGTHDGGLARYQAGAFTKLTAADGLASNQILKLIEHKGDLWIGTANHGLSRLRDGRFESLGSKEGLPGDAVGTFLFDREGNLWVGANTGVLCALQDGKFTTYTTQEGLSFDIVCPVLESRNGDLWIGTFGGGLNRYHNGAFTQYTRKDGLPTDSINSLLEDRDGRLWIGTYSGGLCCLEGGRFTTYTTKDGLSSNIVKALYQDREGTLWIGTDGGGLCRFRDGAFQAFTTANGLSNDIVTVIVDDGAGGLWIGTDGGGLNHFEQGRFATYSTANGLANNRVWSLYREKDGSLWVGTDFGLTLLANGTMATVTRKQGLVAESVNQILDDQLGSLWISCTHGVYRVTKHDLVECAAGRLGAVTPVAYGQADGMKSEQCTRWFQPAGCRTRDGRLWFPTVEGVVTIDPATIADPPPLPPSLVEAILIDGEPIDLSGNLEFRSGRGHFEFRYTCLLLGAPEEISFRYRIEGFDADWIDAGTRRSAFYTNIPSGEYRFEVMARNSEGVWSEIGSSRTFRVLTPWWRTWQALFLFAVAIVVIAGAGVSLRIRSLERRNETLQAAIAARTADLAEKVVQVESSEQRAVDLAGRAMEANKAKSIFLANMSHELRTPLNAILGFAQLMEREEDLGPSHRESLDIISRSGEHLLSLINDVLSIAKIEAGKVELVEEDFDFHELLRTTCEMIRVRAEEKGLAVVTDFDPDLPLVVCGDMGKLRQILVNLLGNAVKFTEHGRITLRVRWEAGSGPRGRAHFDVRDTGCGMSEQDLARLFEAFVQTDSGMKAQEGTGLGLVISRNFVRLMGGDIRVASTPGKGTAFTFDVELLVASHVERRTTARRKITGLVQDSPTWRILVADDVADNRLLLAKLLTSVGFDVREVTNGSEAVAAYQSWYPHLIFMDMRMPVMDGIEATRRIRSAELKVLSAELENPDSRRDDFLTQHSAISTQHCKIVALTASAFEHERDSILNAGCDDFIPKPYKTSTILEKITEHLGARYVFDERDSIESSAKEAELPLDRLEGLPADIVEALRTELTVGDIDAAMRVVERIRESDPALAADLAERVQGFRFEEILDWIERHSPAR